MQRNIEFTAHQQKNTSKNHTLEIDFDGGLGNRGAYDPQSFNKFFDEPLSDKGFDDVEDENLSQKNDVIFENKVLDLHRLYTQKRLLQEKPRIYQDKNGKVRNLSVSLCYSYPLYQKDTGFDEQTGDYVENWVNVNRDNHNRVGFSHVARCKCGQCAICSKIKAKNNQLILEQIIKKAVDESLQLLFITITIRHNKTDKLSDTVNDLNLSIGKLFSNTTIQRKINNLLGKVEGMGLRNLKKGETVPEEVKAQYGNISMLPTDAIGKFWAMETTYGKNGFHPHKHFVFIHKNKLTDDELQEFKRFISDEFSKVVKSSTNRTIAKNIAIDVKSIPMNDKSAEEVGEYVSKACKGLSKELTGAMNKAKIAISSNLSFNFDDEAVRQKVREFQEVDRMLTDYLKDHSITFIGMLDLAEFYYKAMNLEEVREYATKQYNHWGDLYREVVYGMCGIRQYLFSRGLKGWAFINEDIDEDEEDLFPEEQEEENEVEPFEIPIYENAWGLISSTENIHNILKIARLPISADCMRSIIDDMSYIHLYGHHSKSILVDYISSVFANTGRGNLEEVAKGKEPQEHDKNFTNFCKWKNKPKEPEPPKYHYSIIQTDKEQIKVRRTDDKGNIAERCFTTYHKAKAYYDLCVKNEHINQNMP